MGRTSSSTGNGLRNQFFRSLGPPGLGSCANDIAGLLSQMERPGDCVAKSFFGVCLTGSAAAFSSLDPGETNLGLRPAVWRADCSRLESQGLQGPALSGHRGRKPQRRPAGCAVCPDKSSFRLLAAAPAGDQPVACHRAARGPKRGSLRAVAAACRAMG